MSHGLERSEDFAYDKQAGDPWHMLGHPFDGTQDLDTMLRESHCDYEVEFLTPVVVPIGGTLVEDVGSGYTWRINPHTGEKQILGHVGSGYTRVQNRLAAELALQVVNASGGEAVISTMGNLFDGKRFFASIDLGSLFIDPRGVNDEIKRFLGVYTGHDGSMALTFFNDETRPVCANTVTAAVYSAKEATKHGARRYLQCRHTTNVESLAREGLRAFEAAQAWNEAFTAKADALLAAPGGTSVLDRVLPAVFPLKPEPTKRERNHVEHVHEQVRVLYGGPTNVGAVGHNGWAVFNAVGEYLDHGRNGRATDRAVASMTPGSWVDKKKAQTAELVIAGS